MGPAERLQLLFAHDEALLQINTHLRPEPLAVEPPTTRQNPLPLSELSGNCADKLVVEESKSTPPRVSDAAPSPHDGTFCPMTAISRFPYHHIRGRLMQQVASRFFDKGQFWDRSWDLYYIHAPSHLGGRPLILVPSSQVRKLLRDINSTLNCSLFLPTEEEKGLLLRFNRDGFPQPTFLGHSDNRNTKDRLEASIPPESVLKTRRGEMDEQLIAFEKMMEAAVSSAKSKSKSKSKKQRLRIQHDLDTRDTVRRAQCYLGLRAESSDLIDCKLDEHRLPDPDPAVLAVDKPVSYPFWRDPVFISIDVEVNERCHTQVTEVGISLLDTRDLTGVAPGPQGEEWQSRIQSRHLRVQEYRNHVNHLYVCGCPDNFEFGTSEWVAENDVSSTVQNIFANPTFLDVPDQEFRPLVLVGHSLDADIQYLQLTNVHIIEGSSGASKFIDRIDTASFFQFIRGELEPRSLGAVIGELGMTGWNLHNAGNDACYTMQALVAMLVMHSIEAPGISTSVEACNDSAEATHVCVDMDD
ncbi:hypothetical protein BDW62DRAFT_218806 [Aspergillus aurantiobrunneus]